MAPVTAVIVGAGHRAVTYASYAERHPEELKIVGVADPIARRRQQMAERFGFGAERCYETAEALAAQGKIADAVINGTMDHQHVDTAVPLLEAGYDMLLEKPFATNQDEMWKLAQVAREHDRKVMICHVLRYAPFYAAIRNMVAAGDIGQLVNVQTIEHVSYHHMGVGFVRGKWNRKDLCHSSMLMAKCCHDLDLIMWMMSGIAPVRVSSFGSNMYFNEAHAPENSGTRCLVDCPIEADCLYSAKQHYVDHPKRWAFYVWDTLEHIENPTIEQKIESLKTTNPYGRCVWKCDNDVVDHQSVAIEFEDGCTATHNMVGGTSRPSRAIHLLGTHGEIQGVFEDSKFVVRHIDTRPGHEYSEEVIDLQAGGDMHGAFGGHGGGDLRLVSDFVNLVRGGETSISCTRIDDSINGHLVGFCADDAMEKRQVVELAIDNG
ncbi:MAG: putative dehydrogenase [Candidatus Latescibacterota bacterium]